jgi:hypothetical protein
MSTWQVEDLDRIAGTDEVRVSSRRADGGLRPYITIWAVQVGDDVFVRSAYGPRNGWYRRALRAGVGRLEVDGTEYDVAFAPVDPEDAATHDGIDAAYRGKYGARYPKIIDGIVDPSIREATLRVTIP